MIQWGYIYERKGYIRLCKRAGYETIEKMGYYKSWCVYDPIYRTTGDMAYIGLPSFIGVKDNEMRWFDAEEAFEIMNSLQLDEDEA